MARAKNGLMLPIEDQMVHFPPCGRSKGEKERTIQNVYH